MSAARITLGVLLPLLAGCQTIPDKPIELPEEKREAFVPCTPLDGVIKLDLLQGGDLIGSAEMEWIADKPGKLISQIINPIGQPILRLEEKPEGVSATGELSDRVPELMFDEDGFLTVNEYFAGIHREELPCILAAKLPARWLIYVYSVEQLEGRVRVMAYDGERDIKITIRNQPSAKTCVWVKWHRFVGLVSRGYKWCIDEDSPSQSRISGIDDYELKWVNLDG